MPTFQEVQQALDRCMKAEPTVGYALSPDASQIGTVFAEMMCFRQQERPLESLTAKQQAAFARWVT